MRILAIDTSSKVLGVAVLDDEGREVEFNYSFELRHTSHLVPAIKNMLEFAGIGLKEIDAYCISIGPGSFTGLRIGVSTVKAMALAGDKKVVKVPTLDVLARNIAYAEDVICVVVDAKKEKFYAAFYEYKKEALKRISGYLLLGHDEFFKKLNEYHDIVLVGDGIEVVKKLLSRHCEEAVGRRSNLKTRFEIASVVPAGLPRNDRTITFMSKEFWFPRALNTARIGLEMLKKGQVVKDVDSLVPIYLHPRDVQCKK